MTDNVTKLPVRAKDNTKTLTVIDSRWGAGCKHPRAEIDERLAELTCADCGVKLNPIDFLINMAHKLTSYERETQALKQQRAEAEVRIRCRCTKCGEWTPVRRVHEYEVTRLKNAAKQRVTGDPTDGK